MKWIHSAFVLITLSVAACAQSAYQQTNLVGNVAGVGNHTDAQLSNPWGIAFLPGEPFWIANNNGGTSTTYDASGNKQVDTVTIPVASHNPCPVGCPTGIVANSTADFGGAAFLFDTEDGILAAWTGATNAVIKVDNSAAGAVYKDLATITTQAGANFLLAANFRSGAIDVFDRNFAPTTLAHSFTDPNLPAGYAPHGIHVLDGQIYVAYAKQDSAKHDPALGAGLGVIDVFDFSGAFVKRFADGGTLNAPWGVALAPASFGDFSNDILVGNFGDGTINAYTADGTFVSQMKDSSGNAITNPGLWDLVFGSGGTGDPNTLYFTAGGADQTTGLFGTLVPAAAGSADFAIHLSASTATVTAGGSATLNITSDALSGFSGQVALTCSGLPTGVTCAFNPTSISPGASTSTSVLTIAVASTYTGGGRYRAMGATLLLGGVGLMFFVFPKRKRSAYLVRYGAFLLLLVCMGLAVGCGSSSSNPGGGPQSQTITVTATSGALSHQVPVTLQVH